MTTFKDLLKKSAFDLTQQGDITISNVVLVIAITSIFACYIYLVYYMTTKSSFLSQTFGTTLIGLPIITASIIMAMQVNLVVSLGMVGALSIVRFRNAVKDPMDLLFLFWSISMGIICGTGIYAIAIVCSVMMTIIIFGINILPKRKLSYILIVHGTTEMSEKELMKIAYDYGKSPKIRTRNMRSDKQEFLIELITHHEQELVDLVSKIKGATAVSLVAHDGEVRY